jgi:hypothetical protein
MKRTARTHPHDSAGLAQTVTIRAAGPDDAPALARLAELDSASPPQPTAMLVAELDGELRAAAPLGGGPAIADPFHHTADLVTMLSARAEGMGAARVSGPDARTRGDSQQTDHRVHAAEKTETAVGRNIAPQTIRNHKEGRT